MSPPMEQQDAEGDRKIGREPQKTNTTRSSLATHFIARSIARRRWAFGFRDTFPVCLTAPVLG
jgi:hypothetical protein